MRRSKSSQTKAPTQTGAVAMSHFTKSQALSFLVRRKASSKGPLPGVATATACAAATSPSPHPPLQQQRAEPRSPRRVSLQGTIGRDAIVNAVNGAGAAVAGTQAYELSQAGVQAAAPRVAETVRSTGATGVFTTAGVGVVQKDGVQEFFNLHHEDIVAMAMHPNGDVVATGQMAGKELNEAAANTRGGGQRKAARQGKLVDIYVWSASTREVLAKIIVRGQCAFETTHTSTPPIHCDSCARITPAATCPLHPNSAVIGFSLLPFSYRHRCCVE